MRVLSFVATAGAAIALFGSAASAATIIPISTGPFSQPGNPSGVIPAGTFAEGTNTYDFTFTTTGAIYQTLIQAQATRLSSGVPSDIAFTLFKGAPGSGVFVANSGGTATAPTLRTLTNGAYYFEVSTTNAPKELVTGGLTLLSAIPEPAGWATMLLGFGTLGALMRRRRGASAVAGV